MTKFCVLVTVLLHVQAAVAFPSFLNRIPNARKVPNPCFLAGGNNGMRTFQNSNMVNLTEARWPGVGHRSRLGRGEVNAFGLDFQASAHVWTVALCLKDSDGDGLTNGEELGDPTCVWVPGMKPSYSDRVTHPGICDPIGSQRCAAINSFLPCSASYVAQGENVESSFDVVDNAHPVSGRYLQNLLENDLQIHRNTSICPFLGHNSATIPSQQEGFILCSEDSDCPKNFSCHRVPSNFYTLSVCCPSTIPGQLAQTTRPNTYWDRSLPLFGNQLSTSTRQPTTPSLASGRRCLTLSPITPLGTNYLRPCRPTTLLWWYQSSAATCQPFYAYGTMCDNGTERYFASKSECLTTCHPNVIARM